MELLSDENATDMSAKEIMRRWEQRGKNPSDALATSPKNTGGIAKRKDERNAPQITDADSNPTSAVSGESSVRQHAVAGRMNVSPSRHGRTQPALRPESAGFDRESSHRESAPAQLSLAAVPKTAADQHHRSRVSACDWSLHALHWCAWRLACFAFFPSSWRVWWRACLRTVYEGHVTFPGSIDPCSTYEKVVWRSSTVMALHVEQSHWGLFTGVLVAFGISSTEAIVACKRGTVDGWKEPGQATAVSSQGWPTWTGRMPSELA
jgi:hypothetical protein